MRRIDWPCALLYAGSGTMAALIPGLFVLRIHGHHLQMLAREALPALIG